MKTRANKEHKKITDNVAAIRQLIQEANEKLERAQELKEQVKESIDLVNDLDTPFMLESLFAKFQVSVTSLKQHLPQQAIIVAEEKRLKRADFDLKKPLFEMMTEAEGSLNECGAKFASLRDFSTSDMFNGLLARDLEEEEAERPARESFPV